MLKMRLTKRIKVIFSSIILGVSFLGITGCSNVEIQKQPTYTVEFLKLCSEADLLNLYTPENEVVGIEKEGEIYYHSTLEDEKILRILEEVARIKGGAKAIITIPIQNSRSKKEVNEEVIKKAVEIINEKVTEVNVTISKEKIMEIDFDNAGHKHRVRAIKIGREY